jgi:hypothetical protein
MFTLVPAKAPEMSRPALRIAPLGRGADCARQSGLVQRMYLELPFLELFFADFEDFEDFDVLDDLELFALFDDFGLKNLKVASFGCFSWFYRSECAQELG